MGVVLSPFRAFLCVTDLSNLTLFITLEPICHTDENITPTVELNALAMKRGEATTYKAIEPQQPPYYPQPGMDYRGIYGQRWVLQLLNQKF